MKELNEAKLQTTCPSCGRPVTWHGKLDLEQTIACERCGATGTVRDFVIASAQRKPMAPTED